VSDGTADDVDPQYNSAGDRITFRSYRDGENSVIYTAKADGTDIVPISDAAGDATGQVWSPDDGLIAYQSDLDGDLDVYVYDTRTGETRQLTDNDVPDYAPTWRCNTTELIFTSEASGNPDIFDADALPIEAPAVKVETDATQMTFDPAADIYPENSPTEENASREGGLPGLESALGEQTSFLQPEFPVTEVDLSTETADTWNSVNSCEVVCPSWSLYHTDRTGDWEIFRLDIGDLSAGVGANDFGPTRAPNAQWIAFTSDRDDNPEIYIVSSDGARLQRVTDNPATDTDPAWSPDSQRIVFESNRSGNWELYVIDVQTGIETQLTHHPGDDRNASWSSAGGKIAYESNRDGLWQVYVYDLRSHSETRLSDPDQEAKNPVYSNGGSQIAFNLTGENGQSVIAVIQEDGSGLQLISDPAGNASNPAWYFDDTLLAYQSDLDGDSDIYIYDFASGLTRQLTDNELADYAPTWTCGEPTVQFTSEVSGNADIFQADALPIDGEPLDITTDGQQLTSNASADRYSVGASTEENASREE
jgi:Tol biopolymer transport system component